MKSPYSIVKRPIITEESMDKMVDKVYTFEVDRKATKLEIREAVEEMFDVKVDRVNTMNVRGKVKAMGQSIGKRPNWKKAIVRLTEDSKEIEFFEGV